jgi:5'-deoxynucleotidase YfbR-like HD superfamily hydrolase
MSDALWQEFEAYETMESRFIYNLNKLELLY